MSRFLNAMALKPQDTPPVWFMRQAGRYHNHYQALRAKHTFDQLCRTPELAAQVALGPVADFDFDAAIVFSDILYPLDALGLGLSFSDKGPAFEKELTGNTWNQLRTVEDAWPLLSFQGEAVRQTRAVIPKEKALLGFIGGPWTLWTFALENAADLENWPRYRTLILPLLENCIFDQLKNGADLVCIFDSSAGKLPADVFQKVVLPDIRHLAEKFPRRLLYYSKGTTPEHLSDSFWRSKKLLGMGFDQNWNLKSEFGGGQIVQGNFDQHKLFLEPAQFDRELETYLRSFNEIPKDQRAGWILGLGHGVMPKTPERNVRRFVEMTREIL